MCCCIIKLLKDLSILEETLGNGNVIIGTNRGNKTQPSSYDHPGPYNKFHELEYGKFS